MEWGSFHRGNNIHQGPVAEKRIPSSRTRKEACVCVALNVKEGMGWGLMFKMETRAGLLIIMAS